MWHRNLVLKNCWLPVMREMILHADAVKQVRPGGIVKRRKNWEMFLQFVSLHSKRSRTSEVLCVACENWGESKKGKGARPASIFARPESLLARHIAHRSHGNACYAG